MGADVIDEVDIAKLTEPMLLDLEDVIQLKDRPSSYLMTEFYDPFSYVLPSSFVQNRNVMIKEYTAYYDEYNMEGVQFTFTNGFRTETTEVFGVTDRM